jgi:hypothetical protein
LEGADSEGGVSISQQYYIVYDLKATRPASLNDFLEFSPLLKETEARGTP